jgi:hypothetical protein
MLLDKTITELEKAFNVFNQHLFKNELDMPVITIQTSGKSRAMGWCSTEPIWGDKDGEKKYEITVCGEYLDKGVEEVCHIILHEMVHQHNAMFGIKDCNGSNHNKKYQEAAEKHGLYCEKAQGCGYGATKLKPATLDIIKGMEFDERTLKWKRNSKSKVVEPKTKYKYTCSGCKTKFTLTVEVEATCKECGLPFDVEVKDPTDE